MPKNIIICSDGTGNRDIKGRGTNVFKLFEAVDTNGHRLDASLTPQVAFYDDGVGTSDFLPLKIVGGAFGYGLGRNVRQLYKELIRVYDPGDRIYLFGFSRGAFTARSLAGFITKRGLLNPEKLSTTKLLDQAVHYEYGRYRDCYRPVLAEKILGKPRETSDERYEKHPLPQAPETLVHFIGVWDTVDAVGLPFHLADVVNTFLYRFKFPDYRLSTQVHQACHALSIDDQRRAFAPLLWNERGEPAGRIEQVWFAGVHSNVGGGYPKQGMSLVSLEWMMENAAHAGVRFLQHDHETYRLHANVDDKLYDPRAGLGVFYRWKPRDIAGLCRKNHVQPAIHMSAIERVAHGTEDYAPGNLPNDAMLVNSVASPLLRERARCMQDVLRLARANMLPQARAAILIGFLSYYVFIATPILVLVALKAGWLSWLGAFVGLMAGEASALVLSLSANAFLTARFSEFWHHLQPDLRLALKQARREVAAAGRGPKNQ